MIDEIMRNLSEKYSLGLDDVAFYRFSTYYERLSKANEKTNLTRIEGEENTAHMHFLDSLSPLFLFSLERGARCLDIGAGAGFPSVPLAIARPDLSINLIDAVGKKVAFLKSLSDIAANITPLHARAEELARKAEFRESFDFVFARAVASLDILCEYALPFVKPGGAFIAWKGPAASQELAAAKKAIDALGGGINPQMFEYELMDGMYERRLLVIQKIRQTPPNFPRNPKTIRNKPIGS
ncbi:MAG: 16S rRNA (guanine(527)-N(7))-methyltransferase RsmG [Christensenellales bacterium]|jgi:16S rRNA (guanine(527)-N(7))-methyltransferase RsmG